MTPAEAWNQRAAHADRADVLLRLANGPANASPFSMLAVNSISNTVSIPVPTISPSPWHTWPKPAAPRADVYEPGWRLRRAAETRATYQKRMTTPSDALLREPAVIAKCLLIIYATGILVLLGVPAVLALSAGEADAILSSVPILAWIVGPAALAALLAARAKSRAEAWLFVGAEAAAVASTAWLSAVIFLSTGSQNAQSGVALLLLPLLQWAILVSYTSAVIGTALIFRNRSARA